MFRNPRRVCLFPSVNLMMSLFHLFSPNLCLFLAYWAPWRSDSFHSSIHFYQISSFSRFFLWKEASYADMIRSSVALLKFNTFFVSQPGKFLMLHNFLLGCTQKLKTWSMNCIHFSQIFRSSLTSIRNCSAWEMFYDYDIIWFGCQGMLLWSKAKNLV
jgi:hypothetical protein